MLPLWMLLRGSQVATAVAVVWGLINAWNVKQTYAMGGAPSATELVATAIPWITAVLSGASQVWAQWKAKQANGQTSDVFRTLVEYLADATNPMKRAAFFMAVISLGLRVFANTPSIKAWLESGQALPLADWGAAGPAASAISVHSDDPVALASALQGFINAQKAGGA